MCSSLSVGVQENDLNEAVIGMQALLSGLWGGSSGPGSPGDAVTHPMGVASLQVSAGGPPAGLALGDTEVDHGHHRTGGQQDGGAEQDEVLLEGCL